VSNFAATDVTPNSVTVRWSAPLNDGGSDVTTYIVEKREGRARLWQTVATVTPDVTEAQATGLFEGNQYAFRVSAENSVGVGEPTELKDYIIPKSKFGKMPRKYVYCVVGSLEKLFRDWPKSVSFNVGPQYSFSSRARFELLLF
jgi:hypothetical protein